jgi:hypothetical protein
LSEHDEEEEERRRAERRSGRFIDEWRRGCGSYKSERHEGCMHTHEKKEECAGRRERESVVCTARVGERLLRIGHNGKKATEGKGREGEGRPAGRRRDVRRGEEQIASADENTSGGGEERRALQSRVGCLFTAVCS